MFTKGISYWSFPGGLEGSLPLAEAFTRARQAGFESIEVCLSPSGDLTTKTTSEQARALLRQAHDAGVQVSSVACAMFWEKSLTDNDPAVRAEALDLARRLVDVAHWFEVDAVLVIPGSVDVFFLPTPEIDYQTVYGRATEAIGTLEPHARAAGVALGMENVWNKFLVDPLAMKTFIDQFHSPWVGSYFDVGNCMVNGFPEQWIRMLGHRIKRVHLKDFRRDVGTASGFVDLLAGDVNWPEVIAALEETGYSGYLTAEMIPGYRHHPEVLIESTSRAMDAILGRR